MNQSISSQDLFSEHVERWDMAGNYFSPSVALVATNIMARIGAVLIELSTFELARFARIGNNPIPQAQVRRQTRHIPVAKEIRPCHGEHRRHRHPRMQLGLPLVAKAGEVAGDLRVSRYALQEPMRRLTMDFYLMNKQLELRQPGERRQLQQLPKARARERNLQLRVGHTGPMPRVLHHRRGCPATPRLIFPV